MSLSSAILIKIHFNSILNYVDSYKQNFVWIYIKNKFVLEINWILFYYHWISMFFIRFNFGAFNKQFWLLCSVVWCDITLMYYWVIIFLQILLPLFDIFHTILLLCWLFSHFSLSIRFLYFLIFFYIFIFIYIFT